MTKMCLGERQYKREIEENCGSTYQKDWFMPKFAFMQKKTIDDVYFCPLQNLQAWTRYMAIFHIKNSKSSNIISAKTFQLYDKNQTIKISDPENTQIRHAYLQRIKVMFINFQNLKYTNMETKDIIVV